MKTVAAWTALTAVIGLIALTVLLPVRAAADSPWPTGHIGWGDTDPVGWSTQDLRIDCANPPETTLVVSFTAPADLDSLYAVDFHVDFCT
ncbi:MAG: hypothetical protein HKN12_04865, partial [Gemmatimonadetes bacterium]|nr:hypothetical protein [Gemmatimonadota bacterium]